MTPVDVEEPRTVRGQANWWVGPRRMVQTNLREIDADLDPDRLLADLQELHATVLLFNVGGILASYPTNLPCHRPNPYLTNDLVGEVVQRCHANGIRFLARFDFSKANRCFYGDHPDWFYRAADHTVVDYNGQLHTCVNGPFQESCSLDIVGEVLDRYPIDGMFFNMFGYQMSDYSENYHGLCHCDNCRERFREYCGHDVPFVEDPADPIYGLHRQFRNEAVRRVHGSIVELARSRRGEELLISGDSLVRRESNTKLSRPLPLWVYEGSDHVRTVVDSWPRKAVAAAAVHFLDIPYRHVAVPPQLTALRVAQVIAGGGWPDFYCIGTLAGQEDRTSFALLRDLYDYHAEHEEYYRHLRPGSTTALLKTGGQEYRGLFRALTEAHWPFAVIDPESVGQEDGTELGGYEVLLAPDPADLPAAVLQALDGHVEAGARLVCTGRLPVDPHGPRARPGEGRVRLSSLGVQTVEEHRDQVRSANFRIEDKSRFSRAGQGTELCWVDRYVQRCRPRDGADGHLRFVPPSMYGPPEKCYYEQVTDDPGVISYSYGQGRTAAIPWPLGELYYAQSSPSHAALLLDVLENVCHADPPLRAQASEMVEFSLHSQGQNGRQILHCVNSSGHHGVAFHPPVPMADLQITLRRTVPTSRVHALRSRQDLRFEERDGQCSFVLPRLDLIEAIIIE